MNKPKYANKRPRDDANEFKILESALKRANMI